MSIEMKMAWRNVWRNPRRSIITILAIAFATVLLIFMFSFQLGVFETLIDVTVRMHTGHIQVQAKGYQEKRDISSVVPDPEAVGKILAATPNVAAFTMRTNAFSLVSSRERTYGALIIGIDPEREAKVSTIKRLVREGSYLAAGDTNQALVGKILAKNLRVGVGDELTIIGQGQDGSIAATVVTVKGIFSTGANEFDRATLDIPLSFFQDVYSMGSSVQEVVAVGASLDVVPHMEAILRTDVARTPFGGELVVLDWKDLMPGIVDTIKMKLIGGFIMYLILIAVVAFSILNTFLMAIFERTKEFGVILAIGSTPGRLSRIILAESLYITAMGLLFGIIGGSLITLYFQSHGIVISGMEDYVRQFGLSERFYPRLSPLSVAVGAGIVVAITFLTALWPSLRVWRLRPVKAMTAG